MITFVNVHDIILAYVRYITSRDRNRSLKNSSRPNDYSANHSYQKRSHTHTHTENPKLNVPIAIPRLMYGKYKVDGGASDFYTLAASPAVSVPLDYTETLHPDRAERLHYFQKPQEKAVTGNIETAIAYLPNKRNGKGFLMELFRLSESFGRPPGQWKTNRPFNHVAVSILDYDSIMDIHRKGLALFPVLLEGKPTHFSIDDATADPTVKTVLHEIGYPVRDKATSWWNGEGHLGSTALHTMARTFLWLRDYLQKNKEIMVDVIAVDPGNTDRILSPYDRVLFAQALTQLLSQRGLGFSWATSPVMSWPMLTFLAPDEDYRRPDYGQRRIVVDPRKLSKPNDYERETMNRLEACFSLPPIESIRFLTEQGAALF